MAKSNGVHVAVGVVSDEDNNILITQRAADAHLAGLWEFPGGKVETGESVETALARELQEEVGIIVEQAEPLLKINHDYQDKSVLLDVWRVRHFSGQAYAKEFQPLRWVPLNQLTDYNFPSANIAIIEALKSTGE